MGYGVCKFCRNLYPKKQGKKYCSDKCRVAFFRKKKEDKYYKKRQQHLTPKERMVLTKATTFIEAECAHCHRHYHRTGLQGKSKKYCSNACQQAAYRVRKKQAEAAAIFELQAILTASHSGVVIAGIEMYDDAQAQAAS